MLFIYFSLYHYVSHYYPITQRAPKYSLHTICYFFLIRQILIKNCFYNTSIKNTMILSLAQGTAGELHAEQRYKIFNGSQWCSRTAMWLKCFQISFFAIVMIVICVMYLCKRQLLFTFGRHVHT